MEESEAENEAVVAHREVVERLWTAPLLDAAGDLLPFPSEATVLIAAARCGRVPLYFDEHLSEDSRIIAVENNRDFLDEARSRAEEAGVDRIFFVGQRPTDLSYADGVFKGVVCLNGLVTSRQVEEATAELARVASDGGRLTVAAPLVSSFDVFYDMLEEALRQHDLNHVRDRVGELRDSLMTSARLLRSAKDNGLVDIEISEFEWEVGFDSGLDFLQSPLLRETFFPHWIGIIRSSERDTVLRYIADAIDTYWHEREFSATVRASVLTASIG
ncbi:MAG: class I SAM-dependent methyltransferase [Myxococcota bacterium]